MKNDGTVTKKTLIIIPGLNAKEERYGKIIKLLSNDYDVRYFPYDQNISLEKNVNKLKKYVDDNGITSAHFITHSFGSIIFRLFYSKRNCDVGRLVQLAPLNHGSILLRRVYHLGFGRWMFGIAPKEFIHNEHDILSLPLPEETGVIAGNKNFDPESPFRYIIPLIMSMKDCDGKIHIFETKFPKMKEFFLIHEYHSYLMMNTIVIGKIKNFLANGKF